MSDVVEIDRPEVGLRITHVDGIPWHQAQRHPWWRRHRVQTYGTVRWFTTIERCSCGAIRMNGVRRWWRW